jgi:hypothetical protein
VKALSGVLITATDALRSAFAIDEATPLLFVRVEDTRALKYPTAVRWLGRLGAIRIGAVVIDGRILPALAASPGEETPSTHDSQRPGLVLYAPERNETIVLVGVEVLEIGSFASAGDGRVVAREAIVPVAIVSRCFEELERTTFELGRSNRAPPSEERKSP